MRQTKCNFKIQYALIPKNVMNHINNPVIPVKNQYQTPNNNCIIHKRFLIQNATNFEFNNDIKNREKTIIKKKTQRRKTQPIT